MKVFLPDLFFPLLSEFRDYTISSYLRAKEMSQTQVDISWEDSNCKPPFKKTMLFLIINFKKLSFCLENVISTRTMSFDTDDKILQLAHIPVF